MSGQDDKIYEQGMAKKQYTALMRLLKSEDPTNLYSLLPSELRNSIREYENQGAIMNTMNFRKSLVRYYEMVNVTPKSMMKLRKIANMEDW